MKGQWICKKSLMPFSDGKNNPAIFVEDFQKHKNKRGKGYNVIIGSKGEKIILNRRHEGNLIKVIKEQEAQRLNLLFEKCGELSPQSGTRTHFREDGSEKKVFNENNFKEALYRLKIKYPDKECGAYKCEQCGGIHLGKL
jgi:hypothetical protein